MRADGRLKTITPPGEQPWYIAYQQLTTGGGIFTPDTDAGRLLSVSRTPLGGTAMTATMAYRLPLTTGAGGPWAMGKTDVAGWDQVKDWPIDATAMYPPGVAATQPATKAVVHYLGRRGKEVNTAAPAPAGLGRIGTSEYDVKGNVIRSLSPANRLLVLAPLRRTRTSWTTEMTYSPEGSGCSTHSAQSTRSGRARHVSWMRGRGRSSLRRGCPAVAVWRAGTEPGDDGHDVGPACLRRCGLRRANEQDRL